MKKVVFAGLLMLSFSAMAFTQAECLVIRMEVDKREKAANRKDFLPAGITVERWKKISEFYEAKCADQFDDVNEAINNVYNEIPPYRRRFIPRD